MADAIDAEATSSLRFQQGAMGAGVGTIDFISQQYLNERQAGPKAEAGPSRTEHIQAREIRRQQITSETHTLEGEGKGRNQSFSQGRFTNPRAVIDQ